MRQIGEFWTIVTVAHVSEYKKGTTTGEAARKAISQRYLQAHPTVKICEACRICLHIGQVKMKAKPKLLIERGYESWHEICLQ
jgi:hypothetical protein